MTFPFDDTPHARHVLMHRLGAIATVLDADPDALGLLGLGSVGVEQDRLDRFSDLDFFVVVKPHAKRRYIEDISWLHRAHPLEWSFRNTDDGHKALMADGVYCEFAVFTPEELTNAVFSPGRYVWRRSDDDGLWSSPRVSGPPARSVEWLVGEALSNLFIALGRWHRGERLSAMRFVQVFALDRLLELVDLLHPRQERDAFNVERRIEARAPHVAKKLTVLAGGYDKTPQAALAVLQAIRELAPVPEVFCRHIEALATQRYS